MTGPCAREVHQILFGTVLRGRDVSWRRPHRQLPRVVGEVHAGREGAGAVATNWQVVAVARAASTKEERRIGALLPRPLCSEYGATLPVPISGMAAVAVVKRVLWGGQNPSLQAEEVLGRRSWLRRRGFRVREDCRGGSRLPNLRVSASGQMRVEGEIPEVPSESRQCTGQQSALTTMTPLCRIPVPRRPDVVVGYYELHIRQALLGVQPSEERDHCCCLATLAAGEREPTTGDGGTQAPAAARGCITQHARCDAGPIVWAQFGSNDLVNRVKSCWEPRQSMAPKKGSLLRGPRKCRRRVRQCIS